MTMIIIVIVQGGHMEAQHQVDGGIEAVSASTSTTIMEHEMG